MEAVLGCMTSNERDVRQTFKLVHGVGISPFPGRHLPIPGGPGRWCVVLVTLCLQGGAGAGRLRGAVAGPAGIAGWIVSKGL